VINLLCIKSDHQQIRRSLSAHRFEDQ